MVGTAESPDGYRHRDIAALWHVHITESNDPFRERPGGIYSRIGNWVKANSLGPEAEIIDVCCGQGATSIVATSGGSLVTGVDISAPLIEIARRENNGNMDVRFYEGDAADLYWMSDASADAGMMINGIFHLYPGVMEKAVIELARVTRGPVLITTVAPEGNDFFASAFKNQEEFLYDENDEFGPTKVIIGDPSVDGPNGTKIVLKNTPFVLHPIKKLERAFNRAHLEVVKYETFGPVSDVGGPEGLNLFAEIQLEHAK
jgi:SAM-dependent methyltransferase